MRVGAGRVGRRFLVADVRAAARKAERAFGRGGGVGIAGVLRAGDVEGAAVGEREARRAGKDSASAGGDEVAGHAGIVENGQRTRARLDDLAGAGQDTDGAIDPLVDMDAEAIVVVGTSGDGGLELVIVVPRLQIMAEAHAQRARAGTNVGRGVGEADLGRTVEDDGRNARHALGEGVD